MVTNTRCFLGPLDIAREWAQTQPSDIAREWAQAQPRRRIAAKSLVSSHFSDVISIQSIRNPFTPWQETFTSKNKWKCASPTGISSYLKRKPVTQWLSIALKSPHSTKPRRAQSFLNCTFSLDTLHSAPQHRFKFVKCSPPFSQAHWLLPHWAALTDLAGLSASDAVTSKGKGS